MCLNLDEEDEVFELDSWKVDFSRRRRLPRNEAEILPGLANMD
ncbi:DUF6984 family protein [Arthrobacter sp. MI7-26]